MALSSGARIFPLRRDREEQFTPSAPHTLRSSLLRKLPKARSWNPNSCSIICTIDSCPAAFTSIQAPPHSRSPQRKSRSRTGAKAAAAAAAAAFCPSNNSTAAAASALFTARSSGRGGLPVEIFRALPGRPVVSHGHNNQDSGRVQKIGCRAGRAITTSDGAPLDDVPHLSQYISDLPSYPNALQDNPAYKAVRQYFVEDDDVVAKNVVVKISSAASSVYFRRAGPRENVCFKGDEVRAAIVTCGGLCPGLNTVIREIVCGLWASYGVRDIIGIQGGYAGFYSSNTIQLTPKVVNDIHKRGGTILGTSRGGHDKTKIVAAILDRGINQVYIIGGDGTQKGAAVIHEELKRQGVKVVVAGIPKTIDNDIAVIDKSFGFDTAVEEAQRAINAAHVEAESVRNGVGLVKLMGRYSGYIALHATLASRDVDCCLIPEVPFYLEGPGGLLEFARRRLRDTGHMVVVVAEGAGQELMVESSQMKQIDASGNKLLLDIGLWLCHHLKEHFSSGKDPITLKYIDPTYMVRAIPSNASDNVYCTLLAHSAMHGAMAGYTGFTVGPVNGRHAYIPIATAVETPNKVSVTDRMWARLLASTQQPDFLEYDKAIDAKKKAVAQGPKKDSKGGSSTNGAVPQDREGNVEAAGVIEKKT